MFLAKLFSSEINKVNFEDVLYAVKNSVDNSLENSHKSKKRFVNSLHHPLPPQYIIINTLPPSEQECLIKNTTPFEVEEKIINDILANGECDYYNIVIYGKNYDDITVENKNKQLQNLGFSRVFVYSGGMFEWCLLQDIYGADVFQTTKKVGDILKHKTAGALPLYG
jgi:hypothetical protein